MKSFGRFIFNLMPIVLLSLHIFGCGGSGGGSGSSSAVSTTTVSGSVFAGPAAGSTVTVKSAAGAVVAGPVTTGSDGTYVIAIPTSALAGDLVFEASGGTFPDEAEPASSAVTLGALSAYTAGGTVAAGATVTIDPSSTIIHRLVAGGMSKAAAETAFKAAFGYTADCSIKPVFATISSAATDTQRLAGLRAAAFSQLTKDLGLAPAMQFELIHALADDLSDGVLDGKKNGTAVTTASGTVLPEDIANRFATALVTFQTSALNKSKLTPDEIGDLTFNKVALTASYKVEYIPGTMAAIQGKTSFKIRLTNRSDGSPAAGKAVTIRPYMYMATKSHTTPSDSVVDNGDGTYSCTVYFVMSTTMNGTSMGVWELKVVIGSEAAYFYPQVAMPMGSTALAKLFGINDSIKGMAGAEKRTYFLFNEGLTAGMGGDYTFKLFLATKETMMNFPAVKVGSQLNDQNGAVWTVDSIVVQVSTDKTTWVNATDSGNGHWTAAGLTGLPTGASGNVYVKLTVNGEVKTNDSTGVNSGGTYAYQTFAVVPGM